MLGSTLITRLIMTVIFPAEPPESHRRRDSLCLQEAESRSPPTREVHLMKMGLNPGVLWKSVLALAQRRDEQVRTGRAGTKVAHKQREAARAGVE